MPRYAARILRDLDGSWVAAALALPNCWSRGRSRDEALAKLREEIRYRIEYCPCSGVADDFVQVEVTHDAAAPPPAEPIAPVAGWSSARDATPAALSGAAGCPSRPPAPDENQPAPATRRGMGNVRTNREDTLGPRPNWKRWDD